MHLLIQMYNTNGVRDCEELLEFRKQRQISKLRDFTLKMHSMLGNTSCVSIGVREGILLGGRKKFALKITIFPKNKQYAPNPTF